MINGRVAGFPKKGPICQPGGTAGPPKIADGVAEEGIIHGLDRLSTVVGRDR
jgi:hypothetical protein